MRGIAQFVFGFFTRHLGTKIVSLALSVMLFAFVQQTLNGTRELALLTLKFVPAADQENALVVIDDAIELVGVRISGIRSAVDAAAREFKQSRTKTVTIDAAFRRQYDSTVRIDEEFCHRHGIIDDALSIRWDGYEAGRDVLRLDDLLAQRVTPVLAAGMEKRTRLTLGDDLPWEGTADAGSKVELRFSPSPELVLSGPENFMTGIGDLHVEIGSVEDFLRNEFSGGEHASMKIQGVDWEASGVSPDALDHLKLDLGGERFALRDLHKKLYVAFDVNERRVPRTIELPIRYVMDNTQQLERLRRDYDALGAVGAIQFAKADFENDKCASFYVEAPASVDEAAFGNLVLILDIANQTKATDGDDLLIPMYLAQKSEDGPSIEGIRIQRPVGVQTTHTAVSFTTKKE